MIELFQKLGIQKVHLIVYVSTTDSDTAADSAKSTTSAQSQAVVQFFRSKQETKNTPILILTSSPQVQMKNLISDTKTRGFSINAGLFVPIITMRPLIAATADTLSSALTLNTQWIQNEFILALKEKLGEALSFTSFNASDDDTHASFLGQFADEIRSHLGWFKLSARILKENDDGMKKLFGSIDPEMMEEISTSMITKVVQDFTARVHSELITKGAIFFPPIEELQANDRKQLYANAKTQSLIFRCSEMTVLLELNRYL